MKKRSKKTRETGLALFMVMSALTVLTILIADLTFSTQVNSRLAYNYVDGLKAFYLAKSGFKISLLRLKAFNQVRSFLNDPNNQNIKGALGANMTDNIWKIPFVFPIPIPKEASISEGDAIKKFLKDSSLSGTFIANISSEGSKLNINNLLVKQLPPEPHASPTPTATPAPDATPTPAPTATPGAGTPGQPIEVNFREVLEPSITNLLEQKREEDQEFADVYRNVTGKDVVDAIEAYLTSENQGSSLPGFRPIKAKQAPIYSLSELHFIPGIDDTLFKLLEGVLTVYSPSGLNINSMSKKTLQSLIPELQAGEVDDLIRKRDDPEVGKPWTKEEDFWNDIGGTSAGRFVETIKARFKKGNLKILTEEQSFKIGVEATVGMATRQIEAFVTLDPPSKGKKNPTAEPQPNAGVPPGTNIAVPPSQNNTNPNSTSAKKTTGVNLIYWRML